MKASDFDKARATRKILEVKMPGKKESVFPWLEVVTNSEARFLPVVRRVLFDEGEYVQQGEPIIELEQNEYYTSSLGHLLAPETGIIREFHVQKKEYWGEIKKHENIGGRQDEVVLKRGTGVLHNFYSFC